jgi:hypothetical protein
MEIAQAFVPGRVVDTGDLWMNAVGIGTSAALMRWRLLPIDRPFYGGCRSLKPTSHVRA